MCVRRARCFEAAKIVQRDFFAQRLQRQRAIHRAAIQIQISENLRDALRQAALPRACWSVNGYRQFRHALVLGQHSNLHAQTRARTIRIGCFLTVGCELSAVSSFKIP